MKNLFNVGFVILILVVLGCNCQKFQELANQSQTTPPASNTTTIPPTNSPTTVNTSAANLSLEKYNQIKNGMTYQEVVNILGSAGEEMSSSEYGRYKTVSYKWQGDNYQYLFAVFQNDKLTTKSQSGLK